MTEFHRREPDVIAADEGFVKVAGRAGLEGSFRGVPFHVNSEMLATPMGVALYPGASLADGEDARHRSDLHDFVVAALEFGGFTVEEYPG